MCDAQLQTFFRIFISYYYVYGLINAICLKLKMYEYNSSNLYNNN